MSNNPENIAPWHVNILTLFPEMFPGTLGSALAGKALQQEKWSYATYNIRDFATDRHKTVDDVPYGGGPGMVLKPDVMGDCIAAIPKKQLGRLIYLSPRGKPLTQKIVKKLASTPILTLICGRYEGMDERVLHHYGVEELSIGDFVLSGGEVAAQIVMDACIRLQPGVMGAVDASDEESFENGLLEYPHYTRPNIWEDKAVPEVLLSGHHENIRKWRRDQAERITQEQRPDLWKQYRLNQEQD